MRLFEIIVFIVLLCCMAISAGNDNADLTKDVDRQEVIGRWK